MMHRAPPSPSPASTVSPFAAALGWFLPIACVGCGAVDRPFCDTCLDRAALSAPPPRALGQGLSVYAGSCYSGEVRRAIVAFKNEGLTIIDRRLALLLEPAIAAALRELAAPRPPGENGGEPCGDDESHGGNIGLGARRRPVLIVPLPSSRRGYRARGYRPVQRVLHRTGWPARALLAYERQPRDQIGLGARERAANMRGSMRACRPLGGRDIVLVDDVCTTGATLREAADTLRGAGARRIVAAVVAATPLRSLSAQRGDTVSDFSGGGDYGGAKGVEEPPECSGGTPYRGGRCGN